MLTEQELRDLIAAKKLLENPGLTARLAGAVGRPLEKGLASLPKNWSESLQVGVRTALFKALDVAIGSLKNSERTRSSELLHKIAVGASGGIGGAFGLPAMMVELPLSTTIMLRSIADIARSEGHDLEYVDIKLSCLEVFALGGRSASDDAAESVYWAVRALLANAISDAVMSLTQRGVVNKSSPAVLRLISAIASRFGVVVSEQVAAKAVPIVGAASGGVINVLFMDHFQGMARGHFIVKRLEAKHGQGAVQELYNSIAIPLNS